MGLGQIYDTYHSWRMGVIDFKFYIVVGIAVVALVLLLVPSSKPKAAPDQEAEVVEELTNFESAAKQFGDQDDKIRDARKHHYLVFGKEFKDIKSNLLQ